MAGLSPGLTPASTGSGWCVNAMRGDLVWEDRALKSNFPGFLREPGDESPGKKRGSTRWQNRDEVLIKHGCVSYFDPTKKKKKNKLIRLFFNLITRIK